MKDDNKLSRRSMLKTVGLAGAGLGAAAVSSSCSTLNFIGGKSALSPGNAAFYKDGKFDTEAAKDAIIALCHYHRYPVFEGLRENLWISDYGLGEYERVGLAAYMFVNDEADRYMMLDIYLLPNQMLPEHYHLETEKGDPKLEGWLVRNGLSHVVGEGDETEGIRGKIPESQKKWVTVYNAAATTPGGFVKLNRGTARHWQLAGPEGAIITEVATFHDNDGVRHTNENIVFP